MAKKKDKKNKVNSKIDFKDLDDIQMDDIDFGDLENIEDDRNPSKLGIAKEISKDVGRGFLEGLSKKTAEKVLPSEYTENISTLIDYTDFTKHMLEENKTKVESSLYKLGNEVKKILPFQSKILNKFLEKYETDFEKVRVQSEEAIRDTAIQSNLTSIFDKQIEIQKAIEAKRTSETEVERRERITTSKLNLDVLTSIDNNLSTQTAFTLQIGKEYYRKSLELQFKSYFIQADMLKTMRDYYKGFSLQFDNIVKNTGLPEFVKLNNTERIQDVIRTQMIENTYKNVFSNSKYLETIKSRVRKHVDDKISNITNKIDSVTDQLSMINAATDGTGVSSLGIAGSLASSLFGSAIGEKLADKISAKIKSYIKDNKAINTGANYLNLLSNSPSTLFSLLKSKTGNKKEQYSDESTLPRMLASKMYGGLNELLGLTEPGKEDFSVKSSSVLNHNKPAIFDNKVHRSITEIIPMYLSKILKQNTDLRNMYFSVNGKLLSNFKDNDELHYDYEGRKLVTGSVLKSNIEESILKSSSSKGKISSISNSMMSMTLSELNKDKKANKDKIKLLSSKKADKLLNDYLSKASKIDNIQFDYKTLIEDASQGKVPNELKDILNENPELIKLLEALNTAKPSDRKTYLNESLLDIKRKYPIEGIKRLITDTSKIAGSKFFNKVNDKQAEIIAKAFSTFILDIGRDINIDNISSGEAIKYIQANEYEEIKDILGIFIREVTIVKNSNDFLKESSLTVLLGIVNRSLKDNFELNPEVFQTLYEYSPILGRKGNLTIENLVERKISSDVTADYVRLEDIRSTLKLTPSEINQKRNEIASSSLLKDFEDKFDSLKSDFAAAGNNPFAIGRVIVDKVKNISTSVQESAKERYSALSKNLDNFKDSLSKLADDTVNKSVNTLLSKLTATIDSVDNLIRLEEANRDKELIELNSTKNSLMNVIRDPIAISEIDSNIRKVVKHYELNIKTLEKLKSILKEQKDNIIHIKNDGMSDTVEFLKRLRGTVETTIVKAKSLLEEMKDKESIMA